MYTVSLNGVNLRSYDLPSLPGTPDLSGIIAADGQAYIVYSYQATLPLLRHSRGVSITLDRWVLDADLQHVRKAIEGVVNSKRHGPCELGLRIRLYLNTSIYIYI